VSEAAPKLPPADAPAYLRGVNAALRLVTPDDDDRDAWDELEEEDKELLRAWAKHRKP
jgi:hypothetical protein